MFYVFNTNQRIGYACRVPFAWIANLVARVLTKMTGNFYDYWPTSEGL